VSESLCLLIVSVWSTTDSVNSVNTVRYTRNTIYSVVNKNVTVFIALPVTPANQPTFVDTVYMLMRKIRSTGSCRPVRKSYLSRYWKGKWQKYHITPHNSREVIVYDNFELRRCNNSIIICDNKHRIFIFVFLVIYWSLLTAAKMCRSRTSYKCTLFGFEFAFFLRRFPQLCATDCNKKFSSSSSSFILPVKTQNYTTNNKTQPTLSWTEILGD